MHYENPQTQYMPGRGHRDIKGMFTNYSGGEPGVHYSPTWCNGMAGVGGKPMGRNGQRGGKRTKRPYTHNPGYHY
jgi:hypothetical protein